MRTLHTLSNTSLKKKKRIGRGGVRGAKSGRGDKGQRSRAGRRIRPAFRDELQRIPKRRGHNKNRARGVRNRPASRTVTLDFLERNFQKNDKVTPKVLVEKRFFSRVGGRLPQVKIVARGSLDTPLFFSGCAFSTVARERVLAVGGTIQ